LLFLSRVNRRDIDRPPNGRGEDQLRILPVSTAASLEILPRLLHETLFYLAHKRGPGAKHLSLHDSGAVLEEEGKEPLEEEPGTRERERQREREKERFKATTEDEEGRETVCVTRWGRKDKGRVERGTSVASERKINR